MPIQDIYFNMLQKLWNRVLSNVSFFSWPTLFNFNLEVLTPGQLALSLSLSPYETDLVNILS